MAKSYDSQLRGYRAAPGRMSKDPTYPIFEEGVKLGINLAVTQMLNVLEQKYIQDEARPDRGTPEGKAILEVAREMGIILRDFTPSIPEKA